MCVCAFILCSDFFNIQLFLFFSHQRRTNNVIFFFILNTYQLLRSISDQLLNRSRKCHWIDSFFSDKPDPTQFQEFRFYLLVKCIFSPFPRRDIVSQILFFILWTPLHLSLPTPSVFQVLTPFLLLLHFVELQLLPERKIKWCYTVWYIN